MSIVLACFCVCVCFSLFFCVCQGVQWNRLSSDVVSAESIGSFNPHSTMLHFHIHSSFYLVILHCFRNLCGD
ncbi:hypothetical protein E2C01_059385 [Portunus trituberculatus]|uniref:Secreted protein n=1 Tax=Portunus trituberculatus TaxID=210409 RepID=A0A5B7H2E3_PORTR|nr:hypothetical protein [Portunus trituberculatus]